LYGAFVWARRALTHQNRRLPARADYSNFETDEYGDDSDAEEYRGDGSWFADF
jgi:hypothetical protein